MVCLGGTINSIGGVNPEFNRHTGQACECLVKHNRVVYDNPCIALATEVRLLKVQSIETTLYGCVKWMLSPNNVGTLWQAHRGFLLRCFHEHSFTRSAPNCHILSYRASKQMASSASRLS